MSVIVVLTAVVTVDLVVILTEIFGASAEQISVILTADTREP